MKRLEERKVLLREVVECLNLPDKIEIKGVKTHFTKLNKAKTKLLICVCVITETSCRILTIIDSSKISKYLKNG